MWWAVAAAAVPYVVSAMQKKPKMPGAPAPVQMTDRSGLVNQIQDTAFNPNNEVWMSASKNTMDQVNRALGRRGMLGSSIGMQMQSNTQAELAKAWLADQLSRETQAFNAIVGYDKAQAGIQGDNNMSAYNHAMNAYKDAQARNAAQVQGISNMVNAGVSAYNQGQMMDRYDQMIAKDPYPQVYYGVPGPQGPSYNMPASNMNYSGVA